MQYLNSIVLETKMVKASLLFGFSNHYFITVKEHEVLNIDTIVTTGPP